MRVQSLAVLFLLTSGCGTLFSGLSQTVTIQSEPQGAKIYLDGQYVGDTPVRVEVDRETFSSKVVTMKKEGYHTKQFHLYKTVNSVALLNLTSMPSWTTDAVTGNVIEYSPAHYYIEMNKEDGEAVSRFRQNRRELLKLFVLYNYDNVLSGISQGGGEYLVALMEVLDIPHDNREAFSHALQRHMPEMLENRSPLQVLKTIEREAVRYS